MKKQQFEWVIPSFHDEIDELTRTSEEEGIPFDLLKDAYDDAFKKSKLYVLYDNAWESLQNTESADSGLTMEEALNYTKEYKGTTDNIIRIINGFKDGDKIPAPIILRMPDGSLYVVGGNTRLMAARVLKVIPYVLFIEPDYLSFFYT